MEMDWLLGRFAEQHLTNIDPVQMAYFERFLEEPDPTLQNMILGKEDPDGCEFSGLIEEIRIFHDLVLQESARQCQGLP